MDILFWFMIFYEMLSFFHHWERCWLWVFHIWPLLCWGRFPVCPLSGEFFFFIFFFNKWVLNFVKRFLCIYWNTVFIFQFVNVVYHIDLRVFKNPCIPGINPTWSWCMILLMCWWILFAGILLRIFASMFISDIGLLFSFFVTSLCGFGIRVIYWPCRMSLGVFLPLL